LLIIAEFLILILSICCCFVFFWPQIKVLKLT